MFADPECSGADVASFPHVQYNSTVCNKICLKKGCDYQYMNKRG